MTQATEQARAELYLKVERSLMVRSLDEWVMETGAVVLNSSWHSEMQSIVEMAFNKGAEIEAARRAQVVAVPQGWQLVPVAPTEEMIEAAKQGDREYSLRAFGGTMHIPQGGEDHWEVMLAAAPQPPQAQRAEGD